MSNTVLYPLPKFICLEWLECPFCMLNDFLIRVVCVCGGGGTTNRQLFKVSTGTPLALCFSFPDIKLVRTF